MKILRNFLTIFLTLSLISLLSAQISTQTGIIRGIVIDEEGEPLPGVSITVSGPSLIGIVTDITSESGSYRARALPPGTYIVQAELEGFQTLIREGVVVRVGMTLTVNLQMKIKTLEESVTIVAAAPLIETQSSKIANTMDQVLLTSIPFDRNRSNIMAAVPGVYASSIHGTNDLANRFEIDGVDVTSPVDGGSGATDIEYDSIEEIEIMTGGLPAQIGAPAGATISVVTKAGGNDFHGQVQAYFTNENLNQFLFPNEHLKALGLGKPGVAKYEIDTSAILGGPIIRDKIWFFGDIGYQRLDNRSNFIPTTILGKYYGQYDYYREYYKGLIKLSAQLTKSLRGFVMTNVYRTLRPSAGGTKTAGEAQTDYREWRVTATSNFTWIIGKDTFMDLRAGTHNFYEKDRAQPGMEDAAGYYDQYTGYRWGAVRRQRDVYRSNRQVSATVTHFMDNFLGGDHEFVAGVLYQLGIDDWMHFNKDPMDLDYYNGSPYYWRKVYDLNGPHPTLGDGRLSFRYGGPEPGGAATRGITTRLGGFVQDSWTIKNRLTLNIGTRIDYYSGSMPEADKAATAGIANSIGEYFVKPKWGFNPFGTMHFDEWKNIMQWTKISPRIGFNYDVFGEGKTSIKGSVSWYMEYMPVMHYQYCHPWREGNMAFNWWDKNNNGVPDAAPIDYYEVTLAGTARLTSKMPQEMLEEYYKKRIAPDANAPYHVEYILGIQHELFKDLKVGVQYIFKKKINQFDTVYYDPDSDRYWYLYDQAPDWWIPFTTIIPGIGDYPDQEVTLYFMSNNAPTEFRQFANVPESKRDYHGLELTVDKRMSKNWSLGGSIVISRTMANTGDGYTDATGLYEAFDQPNWYVNRYGRATYDRPLAIKLYGSFMLPAGFTASFYASHFSGSPFNRTVTVSPPIAWTTANNAKSINYTIDVETHGTRRNEMISNVDFRIEKQIRFGDFGTFGLFVDVFNLLGHRYLSSSWDPGGTWRPVAENTKVGTYKPSGSYGKITGSSGQRIFKFSVRFKF